MDKSTTPVAANNHAGFREIIDFYEFAKNAPEGTSNPQAGRSSRPGCATKSLIRNPLQHAFNPILSARIVVGGYLGVIRQSSVLFPDLLPWFSALVRALQRQLSYVPGQEVHTGESSR